MTKVLDYRDQLRFWAYSKYAIDTALHTQCAAASVPPLVQPASNSANHKEAA